MPNSVLQPRQNMVLAKQSADGVLIAESGLDTTNCTRVYEMYQTPALWRPTPGANNQITEFTGGRGYLINVTGEDPITLDGDYFEVLT